MREKAASWELAMYSSGRSRKGRRVGKIPSRAVMSSLGSLSSPSAQRGQLAYSRWEGAQATE